MLADKREEQREAMTLPTLPFNGHLRGRRPLNALTPAFVRNVAKAGRYGDGGSQSRTSHSQ